MERSEELREALVALRRENDLLRTETTHAKLLLEALDAVLCVNGDDDPFKGVFSALVPVFDCSHAIVLIESEGDTGTLECIASNQAAFAGSIWKSSRIFEKTLGGRIVTTISEGGDECWPDLPNLASSSQMPALYLPLGVRNRRGLMLLLRSPDKPGFDRSHVTLARKFSLLASHAFAATQANQTEAESNRLKHLTEQLEASRLALQFRANHDQLTGLPNRAYIQELVNDLIAGKRLGDKLALAFVDLDDFKRVNDVHGHAAGDALLRAVADRVRSQIRPGDVFGRISGDEFVIVFDPIERRSDVTAVISRMRNSLRQPLQIDGSEIRPSASIGIAHFPMHGSDYETLRRNADMAMYTAKTASKGSVSFFNRRLGKKAAEKHRLEQRLREALDTRAFRCALQKKVDIRTGKLLGFEVLLRWVDQRGEVRMPAYCLPLANELGLLDSITDMLLDDLLKHLPRLDQQFGEDIRYSINISPSQAARAPFMQRLIKRMLDTGRSRSFMLELTEESLAATGSLQNQIFPMLQEAGIGLSIDDFGTGYSSLATLADLTVDELKIDRSLISSIHDRPRNQGILRAIDSMGAALDISIVAEGIETYEEQLYLMAQSRIKVAQGYLFHRPQLLKDLLNGAIASAPQTGVHPVACAEVSPHTKAG